MVLLQRWQKYRHKADHVARQKTREGEQPVLLFYNKPFQNQLESYETALVPSEPGPTHNGLVIAHQPLFPKSHTASLMNTLRTRFLTHEP